MTEQHAFDDGMFVFLAGIRAGGEGHRVNLVCRELPAGDNVDANIVVAPTGIVGFPAYTIRRKAAAVSGQHVSDPTRVGEILPSFRARYEVE